MTLGDTKNDREKWAQGTKSEPKGTKSEPKGTKSEPKVSQKWAKSELEMNS